MGPYRDAQHLVVHSLLESTIKHRSVLLLKTWWMQLLMVEIHQIIILQFVGYFYLKINLIFHKTSF